MKSFYAYGLLIGCLLGQLQVVVASDTLRVNTKLAFGTKRRLGTYTAPTSPSPYSVEYRGQPRCDTAATTVAVLNLGQYYYSLYKAKKYTPAEFLDRVKRYSLDTTHLVPRRTKSYVSIFTGLKGSRKIVIVDANNNHDFSDDTTFDFDTLTMERRYYGDTADLAPIVRVQYETVSEKEVRSAHTYLRVMPYKASYGYSQDMQRRLAVYSQPMMYREGTFDVAGKSYKLNVASLRPGRVDDYSRPEVTIQQADMDYAASEERSIETGKEMLVGDRLFTLVNSTRDGEVTLTVDRYDPGQVGGRAGNRAPALLGFMADGNYLSVNDLLKQGNYVLLDFWGSWCAPCVASMPALKALHDKVQSSKIRFVGVDYEYNEAGPVAAQKLADKQQFSWPQVIELSGRQTAESTPRRLDVTQYPTFMLLSPDGNILAREVGEDGLKKVAERLAQLKLLTQ